MIKKVDRLLAQQNQHEHGAMAFLNIAIWTAVFSMAALWHMHTVDICLQHFQCPYPSVVNIHNCVLVPSYDRCTPGWPERNCFSTRNLIVARITRRCSNSTQELVVDKAPGRRKYSIKVLSNLFSQPSYACFATCWSSYWTS